MISSSEELVESLAKVKQSPETNWEKKALNLIVKFEKEQTERRFWTHKKFEGSQSKSRPFYSRPSTETAELSTQLTTEPKSQSIAKVTPPWIRSTDLCRFFTSTNICANTFVNVLQVSAVGLVHFNPKTQTSTRTRPITFCADLFLTFSQTWRSRRKQQSPRLKQVSAHTPRPRVQKKKIDRADWAWSSRWLCRPQDWSNGRAPWF